MRDRRAKGLSMALWPADSTIASPSQSPMCVRAAASSGRHRFNINAAINVHDPSDLEYIDSKRVNADSTIALFKNLETRHPRRADLRRLRQCWHLQAQEPGQSAPYSPDPNLIERFWKHVRKVVIDTSNSPTLKTVKELPSSSLDGSTIISTA